MAYAVSGRFKNDEAIEVQQTDLTWEAMPPRKLEDTEAPISIASRRYGFAVPEYFRSLREISKFDAEKIVEIWMQIMQQLRFEETPEEETIHLQFEAESPVSKEKHLTVLERIKILKKIRPDTTEDIPLTEE